MGVLVYKTSLQTFPQSNHDYLLFSKIESMQWISWWSHLNSKAIIATVADTASTIEKKKLKKLIIAGYWKNFNKPVWNCKCPDRQTNRHLYKPTRLIKPWDLKLK